MFSQIRKQFGGGPGSEGPSLDLGELKAPRSASEILAEAEKQEAQARAKKKAARKVEVREIDPCVCW